MVTTADHRQPIYWHSFILFLVLFFVGVTVPNLHLTSSQLIV